MDDVTLMHKHKCNKCGVVWQHSYTAHDRPEYHKCPECGTELGFLWPRYLGKEEATITQQVKGKRKKA